MDMKLLVFLLFLYGNIIPIMCMIIPGTDAEAIQMMSSQRARRQIDINLSAEHDENNDETEIALEAIANLWRSADSKTQIEGSAKVTHNSNSMNSGNTRFSGRLHVHHDYRKK
ncbi:PREDICTED: uncharacterized protein LOC108978672 [Bactrocera latifrons]|uniref:Uncharacterized protein n=1 Tax=Bactrocera latifrons TaxID=174628 RepID=A0A0K8TW11_BACLA|nr:PREDICTED: uncharacterized protein LOC108978672 [Bactrocera latifrons]